MTETIDGRRTTIGPRPFLTNEQEHRIQLRWDGIQTGFVEDPHAAVEAADELIADITAAISDAFNADRAGLSAAWSRGDASTETLRSSLHEYRRYIERLLGMNQQH